VYWRGGNDEDVERTVRELLAVLAMARRNMDRLGYPPAPPPTIDGRHIETGGLS
jgi:hypothetical protein